MKGTRNSFSETGQKLKKVEADKGEKHPNYKGQLLSGKRETKKVTQKEGLLWAESSKAKSNQTPQPHHG